MNESGILTSPANWRPSAILACMALMAIFAWAERFRFGRRALPWSAGVLLILLVFSPPLDVLADNYLFSAHMARHIVLILIVPALLLIGAPVGMAERWPGSGRLPAALAWITGIGVMALWHIPAVFEAACSHGLLSAAEHISLPAAGAVFWWPLLSPNPKARIQPVPQGVAYLATACLACTAMGVLITFSPTLLYPAYTHPVDSYGILPALRGDLSLTPAADQKIGGLLMWVPCCLVYLTAIMAMFARWYSEEAGLEPQSI
jgi:cytochrome c oxidase assembly factor CtaG